LIAPFLLEGFMVPHELGLKIEKIINILSDQFKVEDVYFNPIAIDRLSDRVPELKEMGFILNKTETETERGSIIGGQIEAPNGEDLSLGSVLLDGKKVKVQKSLVTIDHLINFIKDSIQ